LQKWHDHKDQRSLAKRHESYPAVSKAKIGNDGIHREALIGIDVEDDLDKPVYATDCCIADLTDNGLRLREVLDRWSKETKLL
jgi:hypothetical protein